MLQETSLADITRTSSINNSFNHVLYLRLGFSGSYPVSNTAAAGTNSGLGLELELALARSVNGLKFCV